LNGPSRDTPPTESDLTRPDQAGRDQTPHLQTRRVLTPFHIALPVRDMAEAREFYGTSLGFAEGRCAEQWIDFNVFGHQFVVHHDPRLERQDRAPHATNPVDGHAVPIPHCGVVLEIDEWQAFARRVEAVVDDFVIEPHVRFQGEIGEQWTMFFLDPSNNALEFKAFANIDDELFAKD